MAQESKVRLVRCPKCENLLQELPEYSLYKCGGCGAVLRAKKKVPATASDGVLEKSNVPASDGVLEKSNGEKGKENYEKLECLSERGGGSLGSVSEIERGIGEIEHCRRKESVFGDINVDLITSSSTATKNKEVLVNDTDKIVREHNMNSRLNQSSAEKEIGYTDKYRRSSKQPIDDWVHDDVHDMNMYRSGSVNSKMDKGVGELSAQLKDFAESLRSRPIMDRLVVEGDGYGGFYGNLREADERGGFSRYPDEGPSNYKQGSFYGYDKPMKNYGYHDGPYRVETLEQDRAELLRKLDELKDQLSKSFDLAEKPSERFPVDRKMAPPHPYSSRDTYYVSMQPVARDNHVPKPPNFNHSHNPNPFMNGHGKDMLNFYPHPRHAPSDISRYEGPFRPQMLSRPSNLPHRNPQRPPHDYYLLQCMDSSQDPLASYPHEPFLHQPACSCPHCYNKSWQVPPRVPPTGFGNREFPKDPINSNFYQHVDHVTYGAQIYNSQANPPALHSQDPQLHARWPSEIESDIEGFGPRRPRRVVVAHESKQICHPIAGGAPFITCYNCFELLKLPRKLKMMEKNKHKLQCGACLTVISVETKNKRPIISVPTETKQVSAEADDGSSELLHRSLVSTHGCSNAGGMNSCSGDFDDSGYDFPSVDAKQILLSEDQTLKLCESDKREGLTSSSSTSLEEEEIPDGVIGHREVPNSAELPSNDNVSPTDSVSPFQEQFDNSSSDHSLTRYGKGDRSKRTDQENVILSKNDSRQVAAKAASVETEVEVSFDEYLNTSLSQDSADVSREEGRPRISKGSESFLVGLIKKSFRDISRTRQSVEDGRPNVLVNGQPIPDRVVKKAEKRAGPIHPGDYWYDSRGGFWGVMGQSCLGIIPALIEEFNYPMPENCAAGNTGVRVNGRELHQNDLDLLASRGLPTRRDKNYIIDISGRVLDEDTGEELNSLGKLAPTVQRLKRGFGMKPPRVAM